MSSGAELLFSVVIAIIVLFGCLSYAFCCRKKKSKADIEADKHKPDSVPIEFVPILGPGHSSGPIPSPPREEQDDSSKKSSADELSLNNTNSPNSTQPTASKDSLSLNSLPEVKNTSSDASNLEPWDGKVLQATANGWLELKEKSSSTTAIHNELDLDTKNDSLSLINIPKPKLTEINETTSSSSLKSENKVLQATPQGWLEVGTKSNDAVQQNQIT
ncbi:hypothetical protein HDE_08023 [Halotydeus destructor]|nr:hypothetical protein HDE_08023 [Halotydeus destructor]